MGLFHPLPPVPRCLRPFPNTQRRSCPPWRSDGSTKARSRVQQGLQQGLRQKAYDAVIEVLETRFGVVPASVTGALARGCDEAVLSMLHKRAVVVESLEAFREDLQRALS